MVSDFDNIVFSASKDCSLNPSFSGIWSLTCHQHLLNVRLAVGLNPSFSGIWSLTRTGATKEIQVNVLILLLVEYGL